VFFSSDLWLDCTICWGGAMGPNGLPKSKTPSMMVDEMVGYQYASKSHVIITMMFLIITSYKFISSPMNILNLSHHCPMQLKCLLEKQVCFKLDVSIIDHYITKCKIFAKWLFNIIN